MLESACGEKGILLHTVGGNVKWCSHCGKQYGGSSKTKNRTIIQSRILLAGIYPKKMKTLMEKDLCVPVFIAALSTIAKIQKQPKRPSTNERMNEQGKGVR